MTRTITIQREIRLPSVPNFLIDEAGQSFPVWQADDETLRRIAAAWTEALLDKARRRRAEARADQRAAG